LRGDRAYSAAADRLAELQARDADLESRRRAVVEGRNRQAALTVRAERLLLDDIVDRADADELDRRQELARIADEVNVVREAIKLQSQIVERERLRVSEEICARLRPQHRAIVRRMADALTELVAAAQEEHDFREALNSSGIAYTHDLRPMPLPALGLFNDPNGPDSAAAMWLREAREHGLIK
jgi:hypothetical protein